MLEKVETIGIYVLLTIIDVRWCIDSCIESKCWKDIIVALPVEVNAGIPGVLTLSMVEKGRNLWEFTLNVLKNMGRSYTFMLLAMIDVGRSEVLAQPFIVKLERMSILSHSVNLNAGK